MRALDTAAWKRRRLKPSRRHTPTALDTDEQQRRPLARVLTHARPTRRFYPTEHARRARAKLNTRSALSTALSRPWCVPWGHGGFRGTQQVDSYHEIRLSSEDRTTWKTSPAQC